MQMMINSNKWLEQHPVNQRRIQKGLRPANSLWFWGHGKKPALNRFFDKYSLKGSVISSVDSIKGLGIYAWLQTVFIPSPTDNGNNNFERKAQTALQLLHEGTDFVYIHLEAQDEVSHRGVLARKIKAIEGIDKNVLGVLLEGLDHEFYDFKIMVLPDHATPLCIRTHTTDPVPFLIYSNDKPFPSGLGSFSEKNGALTGFIIEKD